MRFKQWQVKPVTGYAWAVQEANGEWSMCYWASPSREGLERVCGKPSPEARMVRARIAPMSAALKRDQP